MFISYRRSDTGAAGRQLAEAVAHRFGADHVFFDTRSIDVGADWRGEIDRRVRDADVVLAVIGPHWVARAQERASWTALDSDEEDVLRSEIEAAFESRALVLPVLVDDAQMPPRERLPRSFRPVAALQAVALRHSSWERDVDELLTSLESRILARRERSAEGHHAAPSRVMAKPSGGPLQEHYELLAECLGEGSVVPVLGSEANAVHGDPEQESGGAAAVPTDIQLARLLAGRFHIRSEVWDLAHVAQQVLVSRGAGQLNRALRELLIKPNHEPGPVHRFLARLPGLMRARGEETHQLIVTTNYDLRLEKAFDRAHERFDLVVFMAGGDHKGRFFHVPWLSGGGRPEPGPILVPNDYGHLPIDEDGVLGHTVILKIHGGALHDAPREYRDTGNFLITEDDYIGFLSRASLESLVPVQIVAKLRESHLLFLGYAIQDWSMRVFLRRVWSEQEEPDRSWAVRTTPDTIDRNFWARFSADPLDVPLGEYVDELERSLSTVLKG